MFKDCPASQKDLLITVYRSLFAAVAAIVTLCLVLWSWRPATENQLKTALQQWACIGAPAPTVTVINASKPHEVVKTLTVTETLPAQTVFVTPTPTQADSSNDENAQPTETTKCSASIAADQPPIADFNMTIHLESVVKSDPAGPKPEQVVILTATDGKGHQGEIPNLIERVTENRKSYCDHHGYTCLFLDLNSYELDGATGVWKKLPAIAEAFNSYKDAQWVFWLDMDAIIMNPEMPIHKFVLSEEGMKDVLEFGVEYHRDDVIGGLGFHSPNRLVYDEVDLIIAQDLNGINAGAFFLRRSFWTQWLLDMWVDPFFVTAEWWGQEQETIQHFVKHHPTVRSHVGIAKQAKFNCYPWENEDGVAQWGQDFVVHFAGCWVQHKCEKQFEDYWGMRKVLT
ncbi:Alpha-1,2-galactosyltransferase [Teratosphaeria destructans]|uniref:Alpha-1,2-galactosyltransferase n=1 Tax=Teratosphaeria destructans TaxID=418781 RepID=A0A9W7SXU7_9PEZI|nr:Alpha-1,2-galactosyltransferase [Teratosphaeria destructans]